MFRTLAASAFVTTSWGYSLRETGSHLNPQGVGPFVNEKWYAGLVDLDHGDDMFYWWFESRNAPANAPLVMWLTGGPGCASEIAMFYENGPYAFQADGVSLKKNPSSWNEWANVIYVDQPIGTGFSHAGATHLNTNEEEIADNMAKFMERFLEKYPQLQGKDFYITGESYAGHYIPAISHNFVFKNQANLKLKFKGLAIGNGLVDPYLQYPEYNTFALENQLISKTTSVVLDGVFKACQLLIKSGVWPVAIEECQVGVSAILGLPIAPRFNVYDIREKCENPPLCYDFSPADKMLHRSDIQTVLGVPAGRSWEECNMVVHTALLGDWMTNLAPKVTDLLNAGTDVLVYSGDKDFICNWRGGEKWTNEVAWTGHDAYAKTAYQTWSVNGKAAGNLKAYKNLKFLRVYDAGHMVPLDQPVNALEMLKEFITGGVLKNDEDPLYLQ